MPADKKNDTPIDLEVDDSVNASETSDEATGNSEETVSSDKSDDSLSVEVTETDESEIDILNARVAELEDQLLRAAAEFENYRKRMARNYDEIARSTGDRLLTEILEVIDNFERALKHDDVNTDLKAFRHGTELIFNQMIDILEKHDVKPIIALGEKFDPNLHEALMQVPSKEYPDGNVAMEVSKGYMLGNRVLRHAKVGVSSGLTEKKSNTDDSGANKEK